MFFHFDQWRSFMIENSKKQVALVTGGTGAIGNAIARNLASMDYEVVVLARNNSKSEKMVEQIKNNTGNPSVRFITGDITKFKEIQALARNWIGRLDILINNAAVTPLKRKENEEGIELQFATNVLGYFRMTLEFQGILASYSPGRIIDIASYWAGGLEIDDLEFNRRRYTNGAAYRQSKQANRMLVAAWADRLASKGISINACHPGDVNSTLSNNLGFGGFQTPDQGAETPIWLATTKTGGDATGKYFEDKRQKPDPFTKDQNLTEKLFKLCTQYQ
jgi:NAD(P)-dependent dehydrogenase (short-subunit alcohol dehydrogenase family)